MTMVENMARATLHALEQEGVYAKAIDGDLKQCTVDGCTFDMRVVMRAVLTVLMEPSKIMEQAGDDLAPAWEEDGTASADTYFKVMIWAALNERDNDSRVKAWHGGEDAPADWDGKRENALMRDGRYPSVIFRWTHTGGPDDIVSYGVKDQAAGSPGWCVTSLDDPYRLWHVAITR